jgi:hypothetical protein
MGHNLLMGTILSATKLSSPVSPRIEVIIVAVIICALIFELVRRKRLMERYAILWLVAGATVLVLGFWKGLLTTLAHGVGIYYAPSALFAVTFLFVLLMLVHFSTTVSRLWDQNKVLAQRLALLQERLDRAGEGDGTIVAVESVPASEGIEGLPAAAGPQELSAEGHLAGQGAGRGETPHGPPQGPSR